RRSRLPLEKVMELFKKWEYEGKLVGLITVKDVLKERAEEENDVDDNTLAVIVIVLVWL
ncbi:15438_t:CDS:2, partial [Funneliformis geosporum]